MSVGRQETRRCSEVDAASLAILIALLCSGIPDSESASPPESQPCGSLASLYLCATRRLIAERLKDDLRETMERWRYPATTPGVGNHTALQGVRECQIPLVRERRCLSLDWAHETSVWGCLGSKVGY